MSPTSTSTFRLTPQPMAALVPAPKYDANLEETFAAVLGNSAVSFVYIGTDNNVYTFGENTRAATATYVNPPQKITMPTGVTAVKILPFALSNFIILGNNGNLYRIGNGGGQIPATGYTAVALNTNGNIFSDFVIGGNNSTINGVPKNGGDMVQLFYSYNGGVGFNPPTANTVLGTARFKVVKLWSDDQGNIVIKDGNTGNLYVYNLGSNITGTSWPVIATGFSMGSAGTNVNVDPAGNALRQKGPFKLINCLK
jgi:hypothetical protein